MTRDRIRVKLYVDDKDSLSEVMGEKLHIDILGKDGQGTNVMHIELRYNHQSNSMEFQIIAPEEWKGQYNDYMIESMVLQKMTEDNKKRRR